MNAYYNWPTSRKGETAPSQYEEFVNELWRKVMHALRCFRPRRWLAKIQPDRNRVHGSCLVFVLYLVLWNTKRCPSLSGGASMPTTTMGFFVQV